MADVADAGAVEAFVSQAIGRWGRLDGIFNIAGIGTREYKPLADVANETYDEVMRVNARSAWLGMKYTLPHLVAGGGGAIVNTGSHLRLACCADLRRLLRLEARGHRDDQGGRPRVRPEQRPGERRLPERDGHGDGEEAAEGIDPDDPQVGWQIMIDQSANGRVGRPDEAAAAGVWLLLDAPEHISGIIVPVDGAQSAK